MAISSIRQNQFFSGKVNYTKTKLESPVYNTAKYLEPKLKHK